MQHGTGEARLPVMQRWHPVEEVRRLPRAGGDCRECFVVTGRRVSQRDMVPAGREPSNQIEPAGELRRDGDDADVRRGAFDLGEDVGGVEVPAFARTDTPALRQGRLARPT